MINEKDVIQRIHAMAVESLSPDEFDRMESCLMNLVERRKDLRGIKLVDLLEGKDGE